MPPHRRYQSAHSCHLDRVPSTKFSINRAERCPSPARCAAVREPSRRWLRSQGPAAFFKKMKKKGAGRDYTGEMWRGSNPPSLPEHNDAFSPHVSVRVEPSSAASSRWPPARRHSSANLLQPLQTGPGEGGGEKKKKSSRAEPSPPWTAVALKWQCGDVRRPVTSLGVYVCARAHRLYDRRIFKRRVKSSLLAVIWFK